MAPKQTPQQGQQRARQRKLTEYAIQLQEKQKTRNAYGMREAQFRRYFNLAAKFRGQTGMLLLQTLERRLDNVVYRAGLAKTRAQARQMVNHRHFAINGHRVGIPSLLVKAGDAILPYKKSELEFYPEMIPTEWLKTDKKTGQIKVERLPDANDLPLEFDTQKIIEFYSR